NLELTRLLPLKFVWISVHDREKQQLRLKFATGRSFYLQLCAPLDAREDLFTCWERLIYLLQLPFEMPFESNSGTYATPPEDILCLPALADADSSSLATSDTHGRDDWDQVSTRNIYVVAELTGATSAAHASGEGDQPSSRTSTATPKVCTPETRSVGSAEASAPGTKREAAAWGALAQAAFIGEGGSKSPVAGPGAAEAGQQGTPRASKASRKEHRERKERREDRPLSRSSYHHRTREGHRRTREGHHRTREGHHRTREGHHRTREGHHRTREGHHRTREGHHRTREGHHRTREGHHRTREGHHRTREGHHRTREGHHRTREGHHRTREGRHKTEGDKMAQKSGHRTHRVNKNEEGGHRRAKSSRHCHSPKGISHSPLEKESRSWKKSGRSLSALSSESTPKRLSSLNSCLRNIRTNLGMKGAASLHGGNVDTVPKRVEETDLEAMVEMAECGQGVEVGSVTSEVMKT
ncbi:Protein FAM71A, partial [Heterocephalus glaber]